MATNWAGNHTYRATQIVEPATVEEVQELVGRHDRVRALGSRHSFTDVADSDGVLLSTRALPDGVELDSERRCVEVSGGALYGAVAEQLHQQGWALANLASLPHISVAGAVSTGTHGSGDRNQSLSAAVRSVTTVGTDGELRTVARGDADFPGSVVSLGALGVMVGLTLEVEPTFTVRQDVYTQVPWHVVDDSFDDLTGSGYSVSMFTDWAGTALQQLWVKSRADVALRPVIAGERASRTHHMLRGGALEALTQQGGVVGPWHERLPHFRMEFVPSRGEELQSEYFVPRERAAAAFQAMRRLAPRFAGLLQVGEIRTVAADDLWLSGASGHDVVGLHFTWVRDPAAVYAVLPDIEAALLPLGARPHWGKCFVAGHDDLAAAFPRLGDFAELVRRVDPGGKFTNAFLGRVLGDGAA